MIKWCPKTDLNRRPTIYETVALPTKLLGLILKSIYNARKFTCLVYGVNISN